MQKQFYSNYDSNKMLMQTFGRGNLPKFIDPKLSERNTFEQEKTIREKYAKRRENQPNNKQRMINIQKRKIFDQQHNLQKQVRDLGHYGIKGELDNIDNINNKINGLIKSIQLSCNKKDSLSLKSNKIQKCQTSQRLPKRDIDIKRDKLLESAIARKTFVSGFDSFGTKEEPNCFKQQKRETKTNDYDSKYEKIFQSSQTYRREEQKKKVLLKDEQDQIQDRIKKIQYKISAYEEKMGHLQPQSYKKDYIQKTVEKQTLKQIKDYSNKNSNSKYPIGSRFLQNDKQYLRKEQRTAKKETYGGFQIQSNKKSYKEKNIVIGTYSQKQNRRQERMFEALQIRNKNFQADKNKELHTHKKSIQKEISHCKVEIQKKQKGLNNPTKMQKLQSAQLQSSKALKMHQKMTFLKAILRQVQYDQDFRHAKHMFGGIQGLFDEKYHNDKEKWIKLKEQLNKQGFSLNINEVKQIFMPRDDQIDPFMSVSHSHDELIHGVIFAYQAAQKHWNDQIYRSWTLWQLKQSNFTSQNLDRTKKSYITLQDLTFYINTQIDGNYRNRDLLLIFNRLGENSVKKGENGLSFKVIIDRLLSM